MDCAAIQEALSAELDGEWDGELNGENASANFASPLGNELVSAHLKRCVICQQWKVSANALHRQIRVTNAENVPDLTPAIMAAMRGRNEHIEANASALRACRMLLVVCGIMQLTITLPTLFAYATGVSIHLDHELGSWDIALAAGFIICAARPARAWGMLPLVAAVAIALTSTAVFDIADGHAGFAGESVHISELMGMVFLWIVARFQRSSTVSSAPYTTAILT